MARPVSIMATLKWWILWWIGHMARMDDEHLPKSILYGVPDEGIHKFGMLKFSFKDLCRQNLKDCNLLEKKNHGKLQCWTEGSVKRASIFCSSLHGPWATGGWKCGPWRAAEHTQMWKQPIIIHHKCNQIHQMVSNERYYAKHKSNITTSVGGSTLQWTL